ncbi:putative Peptidase M23B [uncultured Alphaproteobacteria bacterium]|uniref:Putative Peptidase M23B n=1 Tax=uncultured Alphaproteobacteria bacterium TaxID=91750 RepID=A0A212J7C9_9PROT|nr:putative Peptidase M23B [uncultured Alphaproteobacteria bacterium]
MTFDPSHPKDSRLMAFLRRRFPERMIYIRTGGVSRTMTLTTTKQILMTTVLAGALGWTVYASGMQLAHEAILSLKSDQIAAARAAHDEVLAELVSYREKVAALTGDLQSSYARANDLAMQGVDLQKEIVAVERRMSSSGRSDAAKQKDQAQLDALEQKYVGVETARAQIERERERLRKQLAEIDQRMSRLASKGEVENDVLELRQAVLQRDLATSQRDTLVAENKRLSDRLERIQSAQKQLFDQVAGLADGGITQIEKTLRKTGLNVDELLGKQEANRGGPFVPADLPDLGREDLNTAMRSLSEQIDRWDGLARLMDNLPLGYPVKTPRITSGFGYRRDPFTGELAEHSGIDFRGEKGDVALATAPGTVVYVGDRGNYGLTVDIDHGMGLVTRFAHLEEALVKVGDELQTGGPVALIGNSGRSTGRHLHYEVRYNGQPYNPKELIRVKRYVQKNQ